MKKALFFLIFLLSSAHLVPADVKSDGIRAAQEWQGALARTVYELVEHGERDPKELAKLAVEKTQAEEKKVRKAGYAMGVSTQEIDRSVSKDRDESLKSYIEGALLEQKQRSNKAELGGPAPRAGLSVHLNLEVIVKAHPKLLQWGFQYTKQNDPLPMYQRPVVQTADDLIKALREQPQTVQDNGISVVRPQYPVYSDKDTQLLESLKTACRQQSIPLFIRTDMESSWERIK